jgi:hypothetical protein
MSKYHQLITKKVEELIIRHNEELPKDPNANPKDLILADNEISESVSKHLGNLTTVVAYGDYGSGKTWTCYKIYHDLKQKAFITYIPLREYRKVKGLNKRTLNGRGVISLVATAIAEALIVPQDLSKDVSGVLTNAINVQGINIDRKLEEVLEDYHKFLNGKQKYHVVLLDETDEGIESSEDIEALIDTIYVLRRIFDKYGNTRITVVALMAPIPSRGLGVGYEDKPIYRVFEDKFRSRVDIVTGPYEAKALLNVNLSTQSNLICMLKGFVEKSIEIVKRNFNISNINITDVNEAINLVARIWPSMRWCKDILRKALIEAVVEAFQRLHASLLNHTYQSLKELLNLDNPEDVKKIFIEGKWSYVGTYSLKMFTEFAEKMLKSACEALGGDAEYYGSKIERGFISAFCRAKKVTRERILSRNVVFWLRLSDIVRGETIAKARKTFEDNYIVIIGPDNVRMKFVPSNTLKVIKLPSPLIYYLLTADVKAIDSKLKELYEKMLSEKIREYSPGLSKLLNELLKP